MIYPKGDQGMVDELVRRARESEGFADLPHEVQTDKPLIKVVPCQFCQKPLVVSTFYVPAWAKCAPCGGEVAKTGAQKGSSSFIQAGRTDPAMAADLNKTLVNPQFAKALCPMHPEDPAHEMELKSVNHNDHHGPGYWEYAKGGQRFRQTDPGEVVMHQCNKCLAVVTYSTAVVVKFRRCNEPGPRNVKHSDVWAKSLGIREEPDRESDDAA